MSRYFSLSEAGKIFSIGIPVFIAQLTQIGMNFVDTVMAGRYAAEALAAVGIASSIWVPASVFAVGILLVLSAMSAQNVGAQRHADVVHLLHQGILVALILAAVLVPSVLLVSCRMEVFGLDSEMARLSGEYLRALAPGIPPFLLFVSLRSYLEGYSLTSPAMYISFAALALNVPCNYVFIHGHLGMPELGAAGCGVATAVCFWFSFLSILLYIRFSRRFRPFAPLAVFGSGFRPDRRLIGTIFRIGIPNGFAIFFECTLFTFTAMLLAPLGAVVVAGHQITMSWGTIVFAVPLSVGMTSTMRTGFHLGAGRLAHARVSATTALFIGIGTAAVTMAVTLAFPDPIIGMYSNDADVRLVALQLMAWCAAYQIFDSIQNISAGILRGYNETRIISAVCLVSYIFLGLPFGYILGRTDSIVPAMGAPGFWAGYLIALFFSAAAYLARILWLHGLPSGTVRSRFVMKGENEGE